MLKQCEGTLIKICLFYTWEKPDDFQDLHQDILLTLWEQWPTFRGDSKLNTWVYSIARNVAVKHLRRREKEQRFFTLNTHFHHYLTNNGDDIHQELYALIERLDNGFDREIIYLYLDKKTYREIAEMTGSTENAIKQRFYRIKKKLIALKNQEL